MSNLNRTALLGAGLALWLLSTGAGCVFGAPDVDTLRVMFSPDVFTSVNRNDALAAAKAWIETVGRGRGLDLLVLVDTYDSKDGLRGTIRSRTADLFIISAMDYLELGAEQALLDAQFMPQKDGVVLDKYVLLTRRDRGVSLPDLRGKQVLFLKAIGANLTRAWMTTLLKESGLGPLDTFCPSAQDVNKPSLAVLPVFFGKADACVVDSTGFAVMRELNPQLGEVLEVCRSSPRYLETVICVHRGYTKHRTDLIEGLANLRDDVAGKQILMTFKTERLVPFDDAALATLRNLCAEVKSVQRVVSR